MTAKTMRAKQENSNKWLRLDKEDAKRALLASGLIGLIYVVIEQAGADRLFAMAERFGGWFVLAVMLVMVLDRQVGRFVSAQVESAASVRELTTTLDRHFKTENDSDVALMASIGALHEKVDRLLENGGGAAAAYTGSSRE